MPSLVSATYRRIMKGVHASSVHYKHNPRLVIRSIFGLNVSFEALVASSIVNLPQPQLLVASTASAPISGKKEQKLKKSKKEKSVLQQAEHDEDPLAGVPKAKGEPGTAAAASTARLIVRNTVRWCIANMSPDVAASIGFDVIRRLQFSIATSPAVEEHFRLAKVSKITKLSKASEGDTLDNILTAAEPDILLPVPSSDSVQQQRILSYVLPSVAVDHDPFHAITRETTSRFDFGRISLLLEASWSRSSASGVKYEVTPGDSVKDPSSESVAKPPAAPAGDLTSVNCITLLKELPEFASVVSGGGVVEVAIRTQFVGLADPQEGSAGDDDDGDGESTSSASIGKKKHCFQYHISIRNITKRSAGNAVRLRLLSRHWIFCSIDDGDLNLRASHAKQSPRMHELVGPGVVGEFPSLGPGDCHTYVSGTALSSRNGYMKGLFQMIRSPAGVAEDKVVPADCACFDATVPTVALISNT